MGEIQTRASQTPIEIVLGIDEEGKTTAKKLYEFLEMRPGDYSRWYKFNILENPFAIENEDYEVLRTNAENPKGGRPTRDFKLSANFAKKLSMQGKTERAEQARDYFIKIEDKLKEVVQKGITHNVERLTVTINNTELTVKVYQNQRVVTFKDIDTVHERLEGTARKRFNSNKKHFIEGEDYFVRKTDEAKKEYNIIAPNGLVLVTESGYLMLVKSFTDDLAWSVQRQLVKNYFRTQTAQPTHEQLLQEIRDCIEELVQETHPALPQKRTKLKKTMHVNLDQIVNLTLEEAKARYSVGGGNLREIADEAGAIIRIGRKCLYSRQVLDDYFKMLCK